MPNRTIYVPPGDDTLEQVRGRFGTTSAAIRVAMRWLLTDAAGQDEVAAQIEAERKTKKES